MTYKEALIIFVDESLKDRSIPKEKEEAFTLAIKALEKEAKREDRAAKIKAERARIESKACEYKDLKDGELFRITSELNDKRVFRRDREGSTQINDINGNHCDYKYYPYLTMKVYRLSEADYEN